MDAPPGVRTSKDFPVPDTMKAWVLGDPGQLKLVDAMGPKKAGAVRIDAVAICATDLDVIARPPARQADRRSRTGRPVMSTWAPWWRRVRRRRYR
jgi:hypothetical protein